MDKQVKYMGGGSTKLCNSAFSHPCNLTGVLIVLFFINLRVSASEGPYCQKWRSSPGYTMVRYIKF